MAVIRRLVQRVLRALGFAPRRDYTPEEARRLILAHMEEHARVWKENDE
jgi:hypothetical protein